MMENKERRKFGMMLLFAVLFAVLTFVGCASATTPPVEEWNKTFGGASRDMALSVQQTFDGGFIVAGMTRSYGVSYYNVMWQIQSNRH